MSNIPIRRGFLRSRDAGSTNMNQYNIAQASNNGTSPLTASGSIDYRPNPTEPRDVPQSTSGVVR